MCDHGISDPIGRTRWLTSPRQNLMLSSARFVALRRQRSTISGIIATPVTCLAGPTARAVRKRLNPACTTAEADGRFIRFDSNDHERVVTTPAQDRPPRLPLQVQPLHNPLSATLSHAPLPQRLVVRFAYQIMNPLFTA